MTIIVKYFSFIFFVGLLFFACQRQERTSEGEDQNDDMQRTEIDWQGHRGARGLLPENTIPAFLKALEYPIQTLELDVVISRDQQVVVSHEPWMSPEICRTPEGEEIEERESPLFKIIELDYAEIKQFDCGQKHSRFPEQTPTTVAKPRLTDMIETIENYCRENNRKLPYYNIEIKSQEKWDDILTPKPEEFARLVLAVISQKGIQNRTCIQSFDVRSLEAVHAQNPDITTAYLVESPGNIQSKLDLLSYVPSIYSPYYKLLTKATVDEIHSKEMKVIPWTVNETEEMEQLLEMGVDGIITDYPNRIPVSRGQ